MYRQKARRDYLDLAKCKKRTVKKIRKAVKKQLQYVKRDLGYIEMFLETGDVELTDKQISRVRTIREVYEQQESMYKTGTHSVKDRIVGINENGIARLEKISFDAYNEADVLINAI